MACVHDYRLLEHAFAPDGARVWVFFCTKCLDLQEVGKSPRFRYPSDKHRIG